MGLLVPQDYPLSLLVNREERLVVEALRDRLSDGWRIIPDVGLSGQRDRQIDIVIVHPREGVAVIEVKGHRVKLVEGMWCSNGSLLDPQPFAQARSNAYELRHTLRAASDGFGHLSVEYAVAFPNTADVHGRLPPDVDRSQLILGPDLDDPVDAVDRLMSRRWGNQPIGLDGLRTVIETLRPNAEFDWDPDTQARMARVGLEIACANQVRVLERLDVNPKVAVTGGAGSGKTRLAIAWARRAVLRGERTLLTCYNVPLGGVMAASLPDDKCLTVGAFFEIALSLAGMPVLDVPDTADAGFWDTVAVGHLATHWPEITTRFDTIVIDEAQDFNPSWISQLEQLLDPDGPQRLLLVADEAQTLYARGFTLPPAGQGWTRCELANNCRNTFQIATLLQRYLGGAPAPVGGPDADHVRWFEATNIDTALQHVGAEIDRIVDEEGHQPSNVLVLAPSRQLRDSLRAGLALVGWEDRDPAAITCETVHRVKGLEFDYVIFVALTNNVSDALLYVGLSRAVVGLTIIAPKELAARLGLGNDTGPPANTPVS